MSNNNPFKQTAAAIGQTYAWTKEQREERARRATNAQVSEIASLRNDKTSFDESVRWIRAILWVVTILTAACGFFFYRKFLAEWMPGEIALALAVMLAAVTEVGKVFLSSYFLRSVFFGWIGNTGWAGLGYWAIVGIIASGFFWWSVKVSTDGAETFATQTADERTKGPELTAKIQAITAGLDKQIEATQAAQAKAQNDKTKKGSQTNSGRIIARQSAATLDTLLSQRSAAIRQITAEHEKGEGKREVRLSKVADWTNRYGGWFEVASFLCLLAVGLCTRRLFDENSEMLAEQEAKAQGATAADFR